MLVLANRQVLHLSNNHYVIYSTHDPFSAGLIHVSQPRGRCGGSIGKPIPQSQVTKEEVFVPDPQRAVSNTMLVMPVISMPKESAILTVALRYYSPSTIHNMWVIATCPWRIRCRYSRSKHRIEPQISDRECSLTTDDLAYRQEAKDPCKHMSAYSPKTIWVQGNLGAESLENHNTTVPPAGVV